MLNQQTINSSKLPQVGIAIAVHNQIGRTRECLEALAGCDYPCILTCVVDDGSTDGTSKILRHDFPNVTVVQGDGNLWWSGATNKAIDTCLAAGCDYVLLLNPDCIVGPDTISGLVTVATALPCTVVASVVSDILQPGTIWWAGSTWGPVRSLPFIWLLRHRYKHGESVEVLPERPFETSGFTGRAVLIPALIFEEAGSIDAETFPHYGGDNDLGLRLTSRGFHVVVDPGARVFLHADETGQNISNGLIGLPGQFIKRLFHRRHGEAIRCWWHLLRRYAPLYALAPSLCAVLASVFLRTLRTSLTSRRREMPEHD